MAQLKSTTIYGTLTVTGLTTSTTINSSYILSGGTNLLDIFALSGSGTNTYTSAATLINNVIYFNRNDQLSAYNVSLSALTINDDSYWTSGSSGNYSIKASNDSGLDAIGDYALAHGNGVKANKKGSHAEGYGTTANADYSHSEGYNTITDAENSLVGGANNYLTNSATNSAILGGSNITGTVSNTLYCSNLNLDIINSGTLVNNLGFDSTGNIIIGENIYVSSFTFNTGNYDLTIHRNNTTPLTTNLSILATDMTVTGGTYNSSNGVATFTNNSGGTFNVSGFITGYTDTYTTGGTYSAGTLTLKNSSGGTITVTGFTSGGTTGSTTGGPYQTLTFANPLVWDVGSYPNAKVTLTNNTVLSATNLTNGCEGNLIIVQGGSGGYSMTLPTSSKVANGGNGVITLSSNLGGIDILTLTYDGVYKYFSLGYNFS